MRDLKEYMFEGAWGYDPQQTDSALDLRAEINMTILETIYDECFKRVWSNSEGIDLDGNSAWEAIAQIEYFFEKCANLFDIRSNKDPEYERYYYWWRLKRDKKKDIVDLYSEAIQRCASDDEFINSWKEPDKMRKALTERGKILKKYAKLRDDYFKHELELDKQRTDATVKFVKDPNHKTIAYGKEGWCVVGFDDKTPEVSEE
jgi:hypothetical protein